MFKRIAPLIVLATALAAMCSCGAKKGLVKMDAADQFGRGKQQYEQKKYAKAAEDFKEVMFNNSGTRIAAESAFLLGECHFGLKEYDTAIDDYLQFLNDYPSGDRTQEAQIRLAESYLMMSPNFALDQSETGDKALAAIDKFFEKYPGSKLADRASALRVTIQEKLARKDYEAGKFYLKRKLYRSAKIYLEGVIKEYPDTKWAADAKALLATLPAVPPQPGVADSLKTAPAARDGAPRK